MQFISITGPKDDIDRVTEHYLSKYEIHLENALTELSGTTTLRPYLTSNPYKEALSQAESLVSLIKTDGLTIDPSMDLDTALKVIDRVRIAISKLQEEESTLIDERNRLNASLEKILPFQGMDFDVSTILHFKTLKYRFGRIALDYADKLQQFVYANTDTIFSECHRDDTYAWGVYFIPEADAARIDAIYQSMHFERFYLPDEYKGTPADAITDLKKRIADCNRQLQALAAERTKELTHWESDLLSAYQKIEMTSRNYDIRKMAACTQNDNTFYILCGWMSESDAKAFYQEVESDNDVYCLPGEDGQNPTSSPPTKLRNPFFLKPFEMFTRMYGLPDYHEFDPTLFIAITYAFIFGWMFGDVGHGLCLLIGGALLYRFKKSNLGGIIAYAGVFSILFGFLFGSFFGFEDVIPALWMRPVEAMSTLPFIGKLNSVFIVAIVFGMALILITMILHIVNAVRVKDVEGALFDTNGVAGFVFYASFVLVIVLFMTGAHLPATIVLLLMFGLPLLLIAFKEPITRKLLKKKNENPSGIVMTIVQIFFELFEVLLSYFSNTLSFVRIGAFAVSHAAMMGVVLMLGGAESGGNINWLVIILGNVFVCGMEGLIVGIQVLRLEYYELFSRFYRGTGREFKPYTNKHK